MPIISRRSFTDSIINKSRSNNSQSELTDFVGLEAMEFVQNIIENRNNIVTLNSDFIGQKKSSVATCFEEEEESWEGIEKKGEAKRRM